MDVVSSKQPPLPRHFQRHSTTESTTESISRTVNDIDKEKKVVKKVRRIHPHDFKPTEIYHAQPSCADKPKPLSCTNRAIPSDMLKSQGNTWK